MFQLNQKFLIMLRWPPAMLALFLPFPLLQRRKEITITIQTLWPKMSGTHIREGKKPELGGVCQRRDLQQRKSYSRVLSRYPLADMWTLAAYQNMLYSATKAGENSLQI